MRASASTGPRERAQVREGLGKGGQSVPKFMNQRRQVEKKTGRFL